MQGQQQEKVPERLLIDLVLMGKMFRKNVQKLQQWGDADNHLSGLACA